MVTNFDSLFDLMEAFPDEQSCIDHLRAIRWKDGEFCPHCGDNRIYSFSDRKTFKCGGCGDHFSIKVGTIFENTKLPLRKWVYGNLVDYQPSERHCLNYAGERSQDHPKECMVCSTSFAPRRSYTLLSARLLKERLRPVPLSSAARSTTSILTSAPRIRRAAPVRRLCSAWSNEMASFGRPTFPNRATPRRRSKRTSSGSLGINDG